MRVPVCYSKENAKDWILLELQGSFHLNEQSTHQSLHRIEETTQLGGLNIGDLWVNWEQATAKLRVGNSLLQGKVESLKKPFAVLKKEANGKENQASIQVLGVAKTRILFNTR
ncbi:chromosome transmission fidelity protein 8 isoform 2 [Galdieria sulphuraria]|nr:chromosome transmission fidelity protein 8 isoform 2 [Galdieria sulphuraria]EME30608.1 chromosome transmission fidelity protein 8 isoform 2 [Galdieria sulphuraria]|eukprot:XP_005707128.1 chromosome transmission fidelity protein 8 isoform 2 [Galdieria sulphuraria]